MPSVIRDYFIDITDANPKHHYLEQVINRVSTKSLTIVQFIEHSYVEYEVIHLLSFYNNINNDNKTPTAKDNY